ncbi:MAG: hypothetical protein J7K96_05030 [Desulfobacteraceae bacterium]|nr:hypothetical protein [Desulfobacteraceae bacterium]
MKIFCVRNIHNLSLSGFILIFLCLLIFPRISSAFRPLNNAELTDSSPSLVVKNTVLKLNSHLQPIDEDQLEELFSSLVAPVKVKISAQEYNQRINLEFDHSICFKRCHSVWEIYWVQPCVENMLQFRTGYQYIERVERDYTESIMAGLYGAPDKTDEEDKLFYFSFEFML